METTLSRNSELVSTSKNILKEEGSVLPSANRQEQSQEVALNLASELMGLLNTPKSRILESYATIKNSVQECINTILTQCQDKSITQESDVMNVLHRFLNRIKDKPKYVLKGLLSKNNYHNLSNEPLDAIERKIEFCEKLKSFVDHQEETIRGFNVSGGLYGNIINTNDDYKVVFKIKQSLRALSMPGDDLMKWLPSGYRKIFENFIKQGREELENLYNQYPEIDRKIWDGVVYNLKETPPTSALPPKNTDAQIRLSEAIKRLYYVKNKDIIAKEVVSLLSSISSLDKLKDKISSKSMYSNSMSCDIDGRIFGDNARYSFSFEQDKIVNSQGQYCSTTISKKADGFSVRSIVNRGEYFYEDHEVIFNNDAKTFDFKHVSYGEVSDPDNPAAWLSCCSAPFEALLKFIKH